MIAMSFRISNNYLCCITDSLSISLGRQRDGSTTITGVGQMGRTDKISFIYVPSTLVSLPYMATVGMQQVLKWADILNGLREVG